MRVAKGRYSLGRVYDSATTTCTKTFTTYVRVNVPAPNVLGTIVLRLVFFTDWKNIKENILTSAKESLGLHELKQNKPWFDEECLGFLNQRKPAKMQWIQDPSQSNVDILNNVRHEVSRHFREQKEGISES